MSMTIPSIVLLKIDEWRRIIYSQNHPSALLREILSEISQLIRDTLEQELSPHMKSIQGARKTLREWMSIILDSHRKLVTLEEMASSAIDRDDRDLLRRVKTELNSLRNYMDTNVVPYKDAVVRGYTALEMLVKWEDRIKRNVRRYERHTKLLVLFLKLLSVFVQLAAAAFLTFLIERSLALIFGVLFPRSAQIATFFALFILEYLIIDRLLRIEGRMDEKFWAKASDLLDSTTSIIQDEVGNAKMSLSSLKSGLPIAPDHFKSCLFP